MDTFQVECTTIDEILTYHCHPLTLPPLTPGRRKAAAEESQEESRASKPSINSTDRLPAKLPCLLTRLIENRKLPKSLFPEQPPSQRKSVEPTVLSVLSLLEDLSFIISTVFF